MFELRRYIVNSYGKQKSDNVSDKCKRELEDKYKNVILYYSFCDYNAIYDIKNEKLQICEFNRVMDGFSKFHTGLIKAPRNIQFKEIRKYFVSLVEIFKPLDSKIKEYKKNKLNKTLYEEEKPKIEAKINQLEKVLNYLYDLQDEQDRIKTYLILNSKRILTNTNFKIPYRTESFKNIPCPQGRKTTTCEICLHNCHIDCKDKFKNFCKAFDFKFDCKVCPNKCGASCNIFANYEYPKCNYVSFSEKFHNSYKPSLAMIFEAN